MRVRTVEMMPKKHTGFSYPEQVIDELLELAGADEGPGVPN